MFQRIKEKYNGSSEYLDKWKRLYKIYCESIRRRNNFSLGDKFYEKIKKALINEIPWIKQNKKKIGNLTEITNRGDTKNTSGMFHQSFEYCDLHNLYVE